MERFVVRVNIATVKMLMFYVWIILTAMVHNTVKNSVRKAGVIICIGGYAIITIPIPSEYYAVTAIRV
jgi:hypothetical protein